ncbi:phage T7 F exclusion suppressor FxsA [Posidoniimonas polymericola]|uniref:Phage T7 F exclusion suppressor FxsA n=1 Tax=Posidoniimonas polymericola TaxID=2528002 RepID=A0A5C5ZE78_9BACT|nr:FxsA family protein [Posidoniimonas polymericola]TWT85456.1 phage T7 F exclusion suppressor FxsA [Posidoniimonas polymericola]
MPLIFLMLLFIALPMTEFAILYRLATDGIGFFATIALVLLTGVLGAALAKQQGLQTLTRIRGEMAGGKMPGDALFDGALILVAGAVLITPGVLTDAFGFCLLIPPLRAGVKRALKAWAAHNVKVTTAFSGGPGGPTMGQPRGGFPGGRGEIPRGGGRDEIIDAEVIETRVERD